MQRRNFIRNSALCAIAVSTTGFVRFNGENFEGDCETTTDILGPYYRPDAPVRTNLRISNKPGQLVVLSGQVKHKDCRRPLKNACVELWHCDGDGHYDNESPDFTYRAKTYCDGNGQYHFNTIIPVPYEVGHGVVRPAHFHLMISAEGYQSLITQLYFAGDAHIAGDEYAGSAAAKSRILPIGQGANGEKSVVFNVTMLEKIPADIAVIDRLAGTYIRTSDKSKKTTFYRRENLLWISSEDSINGGYPLQYIGSNTFEAYGQPDYTFLFIPQTDGSVTLLFTRVKNDNKIEKSLETIQSIKEK